MWETFLLSSTFSCRFKERRRGTVAWDYQHHLLINLLQLTKQEIAVLGVTSKINGRSYVPFLNVDLKEKFSFPFPFTFVLLIIYWEYAYLPEYFNLCFSDKDGYLSLTEKQKKRLKGWMRPSEFMEDPAIIRQIDSGTIKQVDTVVFTLKITVDRCRR